MTIQTIPRGAATMRGRILVSFGVLLGLLIVALAAAIAFGGPSKPKPMQSISNPFKGVDFSTIPPLSHFAARDGASLAYRRYAPAGNVPGRGSVVLVHGSSANSQSVHPLAQSFAEAGFATFALDMRGHGDSGTRGVIAYIGQLDDDLEDFMKAVNTAGPRTLVGFSAGGGFAIGVAGGHQRGSRVQQDNIAARRTLAVEDGADDGRVLRRVAARGGTGAGARLLRARDSGGAQPRPHQDPPCLGRRWRNCDRRDARPSRQTHRSS